MPEEQLRQAKLKALRLLERMDRTEAQLREKLLQAEFDPEMVEQELQFRKGVSPELIQQGYEELEPVDQCELIRKHLEKKHYRNAEADDRQKRSAIASLARKGFCMSDIISVMKETD